MRAWLLVALACAACDKPKPPEPSKPAASASSAPAATLPPIPPISAVTKFTLKQEQGGPSIVQCGGVISELTVDLVKNEWEHGTCLMTKPGVASRDPLVVDRGALEPDARKRIEDAWSKLVPKSGSCGNDGGPLTLTMTFGDGTTKSWVDENWGCKKPPPQIAGGLPELSTAITIALANRPKLPKK
jgi:hypothetical protein